MSRILHCLMTIWKCCGGIFGILPHPLWTSMTTQETSISNISINTHTACNEYRKLYHLKDSEATSTCRALGTMGRNWRHLMAWRITNCIPSATQKGNTASLHQFIYQSNIYTPEAADLVRLLARVSQQEEKGNSIVHKRCQA